MRMEHENELKEALDFVSPSALTYDEWLMVGMALKDSGLPQTVIDQSPKILRRSKVPIVKAKIGPRVMTLMCDEAIFDQVPVKKEVKAVVSGIYITAVKGLRGTVDTTEQKKKGFWARTKEKALAARSSKNK